MDVWTPPRFLKRKALSQQRGSAREGVIAFYSDIFGYHATGGLEAQQRHLSYRAILVAIVSQNSVVLVFMGYRTIVVRYVAKWGIAHICLCETKCQGGISHHFGGVITSPKKYRAIWGIAAIVSQYRAIWGH